jgi:hypothetical protein
MTAMSIFLTDEYNEFTQPDGTAIEGFQIMDMPNFDADIFHCETCDSQVIEINFTAEGGGPLVAHVSELGCECDDPQPAWF